MMVIHLLHEFPPLGCTTRLNNDRIRKFFSGYTDLIVHLVTVESA